MSEPQKFIVRVPDDLTWAQKEAIEEEIRKWFDDPGRKLLVAPAGLDIVTLHPTVRPFAVTVSVDGMTHTFEADSVAGLMELRRALRDEKRAEYDLPPLPDAPHVVGGT